MMTLAFFAKQKERKSSISVFMFEYQLSIHIEKDS